jgi:hypothetical protein
MVHNLNKILNEGSILFVDECKRMPRNLYNEYVQAYDYNNFKNEEILDKLRKYRSAKHAWELAQVRLKSCPDTYCAKCNLDRLITHPPKLAECYNESNINTMTHPDDMSKDDLNAYFGVVPFNRCIMLNISPNWKGKLANEDLPWINKFIKTVMLKFFQNCNRFTKMKYVIECGSEGDFIHIHSVFELNPAMAKSNTACIRKGNLLGEFRKIWDRIAKLDSDSQGFVGYVKGKYALQSTLINTREILRDKLDYLIEDLKPLSHQNAPHTLYPLLVNRWD